MQTSPFKKLLKNDYVKIFTDSLIGGVFLYILAVLNGEQILSLIALKYALIAALTLGLRKVITLYFTNSNGEMFKKETKCKIK